MEEQQSLFSHQELRSYRQPYRQTKQPCLQMTSETLQAWKQRVYRFQEKQQGLLAAQGTLFDLAKSTNPEEIDPFSLKQQNTEFWRWQVSESGEAALYFVIDHVVASPALCRRNSPIQPALEGCS